MHEFKLPILLGTSRKSVIGPNQTVNLEASNRSTAVTPKSIIGGNKAPSFLQAPAVQDLDPHLNPNYNFENFIEGYSNKLSRSVAEAVAQKPGGTAFNPLFLYGASGVGKTHLANAIGTKIKEIYPDRAFAVVKAKPVLLLGSRSCTRICA